jgi:hypothetical protein
MVLKWDKVYIKRNINKAPVKFVGISNGIRVETAVLVSKGEQLLGNIEVFFTRRVLISWVHYGPKGFEKRKHYSCSTS